MVIRFEKTRDCLKHFSFHKLFVEELGWSNPTNRKAVQFSIKEAGFTRQPIAELAGVVVFEILADDGKIPDAKTRATVYREIGKLHHENLLIFVDADRTQSLWYWVKRQDGKPLARDHLYFKGQPGDLFLSKLGQIVFDLSEFDAEGNVSVVEVANRLRAALDVERVTRQFYRDFQEQHDSLIDLIQGVSDAHCRRWYASVLLNRLMFIYFLQKKGFLDGGDLNYLGNKLLLIQETGTDCYFTGFLKLLFFEGFAKPEQKRSRRAVSLLGKIKYLNGGLFLPHRVELENPNVDVPDRAFEHLFALFDRYSWNLDDTPGGQDDEINPDVLGYIFEKYINQKSFGAYYTRTEITEYLCERTIHRLILDAVNTPEEARKHPIAGVKLRNYETLADLLIDLDADLCRRLLLDALPRLSLLDPACGSGAFLVAAMKTLINVYSAVIGKIKFLSDRTLSHWLKGVERDHPSVAYFIKKTIITDNLFGVDIMAEATEIARLRLFLALVASAQKVEDLEPLPNIDFNILAGNSLIGLMRVEDQDFEKRHGQGDLYQRSYRQVLEEKNRLIDGYRHAAAYAEDLTALRSDIEDRKREAYETLNYLLTEEFMGLGVKYEEATWDAAKNKEGKHTKRSLKVEDIDALHPFHWGFEFDDILHKRGGFDAILTNPPWEVFKPNAKEFFEEHSDLVSKKKMSIKDFEKEQARLLQDRDIRAAWLAYLSQFPHQSAYFRSAPGYRNQISIVNGKKTGTDINLYKLFVEQCYHLLRPGGCCGIITPGSLYTDLGMKRLREVLFSECQVGPLFGLSNERYIFEGVDHRQKICIVAFRKAGKTDTFTAAFRINPREAVRPDDLDRFLHSPAEHITLSVPLIRKLSPDSLSVMEFKCPQDVVIAKKMLAFPSLGEDVPGSWKFILTREFDISKGELLQTTPGANRLPLLTGRMFHQFTMVNTPPKFWIAEKTGRTHLLKGVEDEGQVLDYQSYRWVHRRIARTSDSRTFISTVAPPMVFTENNSTTIKVAASGISCSEMVFLAGLTNSYCLDWMIRLKVDDTLNMFYVYSLPVPRLTERDAAFWPVLNRAARLICTTPEFGQLAKGVGLTDDTAGVTDPIKRGALRAELDALVAHLYGLTEAEFAHVLATFPLVPDPEKVAAQNAYRDVERGLIR